MHLELHRWSSFHPPRAKYLCKLQLFCSVLTRSDACRLHRVALLRPRNYSSRSVRPLQAQLEQLQVAWARPLRQHPPASRSEVAEARPRQRWAARRQHLSGGGASLSEPRRAGSHVATGGRGFQTRADLATVAILHTLVAAGKTILLQRVAGLEEGSPVAQLARRAQRLHSMQVLAQQRAQQLVGLVVVGLVVLLLAAAADGCLEVLVHLPAFLGGNPSREVLQLTDGQGQQGSTAPHQAQRLKANTWR